MPRPLSRLPSKFALALIAFFAGAFAHAKAGGGGAPVRTEWFLGAWQGTCSIRGEGVSGEVRSNFLFEPSSGGFTISQAIQPSNRAIRPLRFLYDGNGSLRLAEAQDSEFDSSSGFCDEQSCRTETRLDLRVLWVTRVLSWRRNSEGMVLQYRSEMGAAREGGQASATRMSQSCRLRPVG